MHNLGELCLKSGRVCQKEKMSKSASSDHKSIAIPDMGIRIFRIGTNCPRRKDNVSKISRVFPFLVRAYVETLITFVHFREGPGLAPSVLPKQHPTKSDKQKASRN